MVISCWVQWRDTQTRDPGLLNPVIVPDWTVSSDIFATFQTYIRKDILYRLIKAPQ